MDCSTLCQVVVPPPLIPEVLRHLHGEHTREHQQVADLPELNENKEKGLGNLKLPALIVARFTNACTYT